MSIFGNIMSAVFGKSAAPAAGSTSGTTAAVTPATTGTTAAGTPVTGKALTRAEVEGMIEKIADEQDQDYNWQQSIVDLMKLLKLDSSLAARKDLAKELGYTGALNGSAEMNIWLHKQVMTKLAEGGGQVPDSLKTKKA